MRWALLAVLLASLLPSAAAACSCVSTQSILQSELTDERAIVFIGTVDGMKGSARTGSFFTLERLLLVRPWLFLRGSSPERPVELWAGSTAGSGDCGAHLRMGWTYLVVARRHEDGKLAAGQCSMTAPLFVYGGLVGIPATLMLVAGALGWALWRRLRKAHPPREPAAVGQRTTAWTRALVAWLCASGGLLALTVLLWNLAPWLSPPFEATVCNRVASDPLEQVEARLLPESPGSPPVQLGRLLPGECRTVSLPVKGLASLRLRYQLQGSPFTVQDAMLASVGGGLFTETAVKGPGQSESWPGMLEPAPWIFALGLGILACLSGALAALCGATWVALRTWRRARSHANPAPT